MLNVSWRNRFKTLNYTHCSGKTVSPNTNSHRAHIHCISIILSSFLSLSKKRSNESKCFTSITRKRTELYDGQEPSSSLKYFFIQSNWLELQFLRFSLAFLFFLCKQLNCYWSTFFLGLFCKVTAIIWH